MAHGPWFPDFCRPGSKRQGLWSLGKSVTGRTAPRLAIEILAKGPFSLGDTSRIDMDHQGEVTGRKERGLPTVAGLVDARTAGKGCSTLTPRRHGLSRSKAPRDTGQTADQSGGVTKRQTQCCQARHGEPHTRSRANAIISLPWTSSRFRIQRHPHEMSSRGFSNHSLGNWAAMSFDGGLIARSKGFRETQARRHV
jgi:hypothetical protein